MNSALATLPRAECRSGAAKKHWLCNSFSASATSLRFLCRPKGSRAHKESTKRGGTLQKGWWRTRHGGGKSPRQPQASPLRLTRRGQSGGTENTCRREWRCEGLWGHSAGVQTHRKTRPYRHESYKEKRFPNFKTRLDLLERWRQWKVRREGEQRGDDNADPHWTTTDDRILLASP